MKEEENRGREGNRTITEQGTPARFDQANLSLMLGGAKRRNSTWRAGCLRFSLNAQIELPSLHLLKFLQ